MITKSKGIQGEVFTITAGGNRAVVLPEVGGNLIGLNIKGTEVLNPYSSYEEIRKAPTSYGFPLLFPPNRIDGGRFTYAGKTYQFDINEEATGNSLHGFLHDKPWEFETVRDSEEEAVFCLRFTADANTSFYRVYPVTFVAEMLYTLNREGLTQKVSVTNTGKETMPYGIGWHTSFRITPSTLMKVSVGCRVEMSERVLPTGRLLPLSAEEKKMRGEGLSPLYADMDDHFTGRPIDGFTGAVLMHPEEGVQIIYRTDPLYKHWMIWNCSMDGRFVCIEPQNWRVNAPNLPLEPEESGMAALAPGETMSATSTITVQTL